MASWRSQLLSTLAPRAKDQLLGRLAADAGYRRNAAGTAAVRRERIAAEYERLHPSLWTLSEEFLDPAFVALVRAAKRGAAANDPARAALARECSGVYALPIFTRRFCELLCEELAHFARSGLPVGRPNSMNAYGTLVGELGMYPTLLDPLMNDCAPPPPPSNM